VHYLDYNAGAPLRPEVAAAIIAAMARAGNASSIHAAGRAQRRAIEAARTEVAALVGAATEDVVFTSGGSEANALALRGLPAERILISAIEHESVRRNAEATGRPVEFVPVDRRGVVRLDALAAMLEAGEGPALVSAMAANNETGVIQPIDELARLVRQAGALFHCDAVQAVGRMPFDMARSGIDAVTLSAHKLGGPQGVGALVLAPGRAIEPLVRGGAQEDGRRAGTENVAGIVGFGTAARLAQADCDAASRLVRLRDGFEAALGEAATVVGKDAPRLCNTSCVIMPGVKAETQVIAFDLAGYAVSAGAACSSGKVARSGVLTAMGYDEDEAAAAIRVSIGPESEEAALIGLAQSWRDLLQRHRRRLAA